MDPAEPTRAKRQKTKRTTSGKKTRRERRRELRKKPRFTMAGFWARSRRFFHWLIWLRGSPHAIALGMACGFFVAFTPTVGAQAILVVLLATLVNANRPVAILPIWITNPVTMAPIYAFTHWIGSFFWAGSDPERAEDQLAAGAEQIEALDPLSARARVEVFLDMGLDVFVPLWIGGVLVGLVSAAIAYPLTLRLVTRLRERPPFKALRRRRMRRRDRRGRTRERRRRNLPGRVPGRGEGVVEPSGIEPPTSALRTRRSPN